MIAILLVALFATVAFASALTLVDAAVRGRTAVRQVRGELARCEAIRSITVTFAGFSGSGADGSRMPALRPAGVSAGRSSKRRTIPAQAPRRVAA